MLYSEKFRVHITKLTHIAVLCIKVLALCKLKNTTFQIQSDSMC